MLLLKKGQLNEGANILNLSPCTRVLFNAIKDNWLIQTSVWFFQYVQSKLDMYGLNYENEKKKRYKHEPVIIIIHFCVVFKYVW